jgi:tetratricopeptide (TPR) repeat protein
MKLHFPLVLIVVLATGCSGVFNPLPRNSYQSTSVEARQVRLDASVHERSDLLHNYLMGELALKREQTDQALEYFAQTSKRLKSPIDRFHQNLALLYFKNGDIQSALVEVDRELHANPTDWQAQYLKAGLLFASGHLDAVRAYYNLSKKSNRKRPEPLMQEYRLACYEGKNFLAGKLANKLVQDFSAVAQILSIDSKDLERCLEPSELGIKLALYYLQAGATEETLRELYVLLHLDPENAQARLALANTYVGLSRRQDAIKELLKIQPDQELYVRARTLASFYARQDQNLDQAEQIITEAWQASDQSSSLLPFYIAILRDVDKDEEALELLRDRLSQEPENADLWYEYGILLHISGDVDGSIAAMEKTLELSPKHAPALNHIAYTLAEEERDLDRALALVQQSLQLSPGDASFIDTLGWVYFKQGRLKQAEEELLRAVELSNSEWIIVEHYADVLTESGRGAQALDFYRQALEYINDHDLRDHESQSGAKRLKNKIGKLSDQ